MKIRNLLSVLGGMASTVRYSQSRLAKPESVMEHTGFVALTALAIGKQINAEGNVRVVDIGTLLEKALIHDMDEVVTGDLSRPTKYSSTEMLSLMEKLSSSAMQEIDKDCDTAFSEKWDVAKKGGEGAIVALADCLAVLHKAHDEIVMRGNKTIIFGSPNGLEILLRSRIDDVCDHFDVESISEWTDISSMLVEIKQELAK